MLNAVRLFVILLLLMPVVVTYAQPNPDSLWNVWNSNGASGADRLQAAHLLFYYQHINDSIHRDLALSELELASEQGKKDLLADAYLNLGDYYLSVAWEVDSAYRYFKIADSLLQHSPNDTVRYKLLYSLGTCFYRLGNLVESERAFTEALDLRGYEAVDRTRVHLLNWIAEIHNNRGNCGQAMPFYNQSLQLCEQLQDSLLLARTHEYLGNCSLDSQDLERALEEYKFARKVYADLNSYGGEASVLGMMGFIYLDQKREDTGISMLSESLRLARLTGDKYHISYSLLWLGMAYEQIGRLDSAEHYLKRQFELISEVGDKTGILDAHSALGSLYFKMGNTRYAIDHGEKALVIAKEVDHVGRMVSILIDLSEYYKAAGNAVAALERLALGKTLNDSLVREENKRGLLRQEYQYAYDKKAYADSLDFAKKEELNQLEIEKRDANLAKQRIGLVATGGGILLLVMLAYSIRKGKKRSDELLLNILPEEVAEELKQKGHSDAQLIDHVTVLFTDFKGFTALSEQLSPKELVEDLHECFSAFDRICEKYNIEKIKTIGDAYMAAGGLPSPKTTHAQDVVKAALEIAEVVEKGKVKKIAVGLPFFEIRIGVHTGPVVAGIVGVKKFQYDIWGDTVNTASRMESSGEVGQVNISEATYDLLKKDPSFRFSPRGKIQAKGKGELEMYFVSKNLS